MNNISANVKGREMHVIGGDALKMHLTHLDGWGLEKMTKLKKTYTLKDFAYAMVFVNAVARIAESQNHHPNILIKYNMVDLEVWTHTVGGITQKDIDLAAKIDAIL